jgi:hypothetical protein
MHAAGHWRYYGTRHREQHWVVYGIDCPSFEAECNAYAYRLLVKYPRNTLIKRPVVYYVEVVYILYYSVDSSFVHY